MDSALKQKFAWNSSLLSEDDKDFDALMKILMESSSLEEFLIHRDLMAVDIDAANGALIDLHCTGTGK